MKTVKNLKYFEATGRRKESVARVRLYITGKDKTATVADKKITAGEIIANGSPIATLFASVSEQQQYMRPIVLTNTNDRFAISILVKGGGKNGQLDAVILGISRALTLVDTDTYKPLLSAEGLLTRDPRVRERRKVGTGGKARRQKQSPKR
ncbi:30S ribosomal protein S9 [Candidatus Roizmanbacteria bacterium]|nr:30S ribosomal protein S9 [Candidatus Roizmanbacteria bacterium]